MSKSSPITQLFFRQFLLTGISHARQGKGQYGSFNRESPETVYDSAE